MGARGLRTAAWAVVLVASFGSPHSGLADSAPASKARVEAALDNILTLERPKQDGYATVWDGNKYVQCGHTHERGFRCEAAGSRMQPSLERVLTPERVAHLATLGWRLDPAFGNYVQTFVPETPPSQIADKILQALGEAYGADLAQLEVRTAWVASEPCPPRNGPSQNLAGMINDARAMAATAVRACAYIPREDSGPAVPASSLEDLVGLYGARMKGEIQRLRVNLDRHVYVAFETEIGYVQCAPERDPPSVYCEAQSAESWPALAAVLSPERIARLHALGFADPGRSPNYAKTYPTDKFDDRAIAQELLTILHDVYGYNGQPKLEVKTE